MLIPRKVSKKKSNKRRFRSRIR